MMHIKYLLLLIWLPSNNTGSTWKREREKYVLFNEAFNTYLRLYGIRHMVTDHSDSEKWNPLLPHRLIFSISSKESFICTIPHITAFVILVVGHWLEWEIVHWGYGSTMQYRSDDPLHHKWTLYLWAMSRSLSWKLTIYKQCFQQALNES